MKAAIELKLTRPLIFLDLETTGVDIQNDRIIELALLRINVSGKEEVKTARFNPGIPIPAAATEVHGIRNVDVADCPRFEALAKGILMFIDGADVAGFNSNRFDVPMLFLALQRAGLMWSWQNINLIDVCNIFKIKESRDLSAGVKFYLGRDHVEAHAAEADVQATRDIFFEQLARYEDLPKDFRALALFSNHDKEIVDLAGKFTRDKDGDIIFAFGKHIGKKAKTEKGYLQWMGNDPQFTADTKRVANSLSFTNRK